MSVLLLLRQPSNVPPVFIPPVATHILTINGVVQKIQPGWVVSETANGRNTLDCQIVSVDASYRPPIGGEIILAENGKRIFGGLIETPSEAGIGDRGFTGITTRIAATDFSVYAERRQVDFDTDAAQMKATLQALVPYMAPYGVVLDQGQVDGPVLPALSYRAKTLREMFDEIATLSSGIVGGTIMWGIDYNKVFRMFLAGTSTAPVGIFDGDRTVEGDITVEPSHVDYANSIVLKAGTGQHDVMDPFTGNGWQASFPLNYDLVTHRGYVIRSGVFETLGVGTGLSSGATWTYDPQTRYINRVSPPALGDDIRMPYTAQFPVTVFADGGAAPADLVERVMAAPDVFDKTVAQGLANAYLARAMITARTVRYTTAERDLHPGQTQQIVVAKRNLSGAFLITDVRVASISAKHVRRTVTAVEGATVPESWRDTFSQWTGSAGTSGATPASGVVAVVSAAGVGGAGTPGRMPKWSGQGVIGNSIVSDNGAAITVDGICFATEFGGVGIGLKSLTAGELVGSIPVTALTDRSLADLGTKSAADLTSGALAYARLPSGDGVWVGAPTVSGLLTLLAGLLVTGTLSADDIRITTNNTAYKARNAAGTADLPLITGDGLNKTTLFCNSARLRFANPSTAAAPGGAPVGALNVTIDGVGDVLIPYY